MRLADTTALITGGATGIGRAIGLRFAQEGARVVVADINVAAGTQTAADTGGHFVRCDTASPADAHAAVAAAVAACGGLDVLVNSAAHLGGHHTVSTMPDDEWRAVLSVSLDGVYYCSKYALPELVRSGRGAVIHIVICYDMDTPDYMRQLGEQRVDLVIAGSGDWKAISPWHAQVAMVRAIENGFALVRPVRGGLQVQADQFGRITASQDFFTGGDRVVRGSVAAQHVPTWYPRVGDAVALLAVTGCAALLALAAVTRVQCGWGARQVYPVPRTS